MTFEPIDDRLLHKLDHSLNNPNPTSGFPGPSAPPVRSPAPFQTGVFLLSDVPNKPLSWLWPGRIPLGHLTLLDAAPGCGLSLFALTLAACVSRGSPLPDGTPTQQGPVILLAPYDSASDTIKPRLEAAGGDPAHVLLFCPLVEEASHALSRTRPFAFPQDLDHLATMIRCLQARLVILDPASAIPGLSRCLPALIELCIVFRLWQQAVYLRSCATDEQAYVCSLAYFLSRTNGQTSDGLLSWQRRAAPEEDSGCLLVCFL